MQNHISDNDDLIINEEAIIFPTMENRDLVQQYLSIYQGLQTSNRLKEPLYLILMSYWLHGPSFADRTIEAKKLLPSIEKNESTRLSLRCLEACPFLLGLAEFFL